MESFSFNHSLGEVNVNLTFVVPEYKLCMGTFAEMCARAAKAFGHMEQSIENYIHSPLEIVKQTYKTRFRPMFFFLFRPKRHQMYLN